MPSTESSPEVALLVVRSGDTSHEIGPGRGAVTIGRDPQDDVRIDEISGEHLHAEPVDGSWRIVDKGPNGMFVDGRRTSSVTVTDRTTVRLGDPSSGEVLTFEIMTSRSAGGQPDGHKAGEPDRGMARAGAAAAARRRELGISQRSLAADGIINAGALIAFEKGRSWPRERTQAKLEQVLQWPAGTIARIRRGEPDAAEAVAEAVAPETPRAATEGPHSDAPTSLIAQAIVAAVDGCGLAIAALPPADDPEFTERATPILADLRQLEAIAVRATRISRITPELIKALGTVRRHYDELMTRGATAPDAPLAQRLYAARRRANLSPAETAEAAGVTEEMIVRAEADEAVPSGVADALETLIGHIH
ncbi:FHA domain-containing protein [Mycobacterium sp. SMC-2]|uniref:ESX-1 type VII secretion system transcriptional regulator EspM n=1 Tax=Mycobacterium sp. SMC-2 TaxID=2857058 RepID=UPI0021B431D4|nr:FHA domain-containing protein [Mycobacterium sp. SMC-2]UXA07111.1 FHA domain-containing protein [Mycobacterium sp. SMC-2]